MNTLELMREIRNIPPEVLRWRERLILLCLALRCDQRLICWPSVRRLAADAGLSTSSTSTALAELERRGLIRRWWHKRSRHTAIKADQVIALKGDSGTIPRDGTVPPNGIEDTVRRNRGSRETVQKNKRKRKEESPLNPPTSGGTVCDAILANDEAANNTTNSHTIRSAVHTAILRGNLPTDTTDTAEAITAAYLSAYSQLTGTTATDAIDVARWLRVWRKSGLSLTEYSARLSAVAQITTERTPVRAWTTNQISAAALSPRQLPAAAALERVATLTAHHGIEEAPQQHGATIWRWHTDATTAAAIQSAVTAAGGYGKPLDPDLFTSTYNRELSQ